MLEFYIWDTLVLVRLYHGLLPAIYHFFRVLGHLHEGTKCIYKSSGSGMGHNIAGDSSHGKDKITYSIIGLYGTVRKIRTNRLAPV